jgi:4-amino-4-deoxy-L-arabinose transferase-like glycosyltransferase
MKNTRTVLLFIWMCFVFRGLFYCAVLPVWEGYDEPFHFAYFQQLETNRSIPRPDAPVSRQIEQSLHLLPLPWLMAQSHLPPPLFSHEQYWTLAPSKRLDLQHTLQSMPQDWAREAGTENIGNYESKQMPLYYLLLFPVLHWSASLAFPAQVFLLRFVSVLLASLVVPLGYQIARSTFRNNALALSMLALIATLPELLINLARVGNESLALVLFSLMLYAAVRTVESASTFKYFYLLAIALGLALLTKGYFLAAVPVFFLIALWRWWRWPAERPRLALNALLATIVLIAIAGPWYLRVHAQTGSWSGESYEITLRSVSKLQLLAQARHVNWVSAIVSILLSHVWFGAWSFLKFSRAIYLLFGLIILAALLGMTRTLLAWRKNRCLPQLETFDTSKLLVLLLFYLFFWLGLAYDTLIIYAASGVSASNGWYMYSLIVALLPSRFKHHILPILTALFAVLDVAGMNLLLLPYYTGITSHTSQDRVPLAGIGQLFHTGILEFARRVSANKPALLGPGVLIFLWILYLAATVLLVLLAFRLSRRLMRVPNN